MPDFEERADQLSKEAVEDYFAQGKVFENARKKLLSKGAKFLVGPRGTGKTHIMRFAYQSAIKDKSAPLPVYASFNRYLHLEPLLKRSPDALKRFHSWVLARILLGLAESASVLGIDVSFLEQVDNKLNTQKLTDLVSLLERNSGEDLYEEFGQYITISHVIRASHDLCHKSGRRRVVLLLDDAALSLSDQFLIAFFEIFRLLKLEDISPKASVYPGSTQYGPSFHVSHEVEEVHLWLSVDDPDYSEIMGDIAARRIGGNDLQEIKKEILELLKYVSFGVPRAFLRLLREYFNEKAGTSQSKINKIIQKQAELVGTEYDSLSIKLQQFSTIVKMGRKLFDKAVLDVAATQKDLLGVNRCVIIGIKEDGTKTPLCDRMLKFLVEVGLLYPLQMVSHGTDRRYERYIPHLAFLYQAGAFRKGKVTNFSSIYQTMALPASKHPVRRALKTLLSKAEVENLKLDLPACDGCGAERINDSQLFCHKCGKILVVSSLFENCMKLALENVPGISAAMIRRIHDNTKIRFISDVVASQNPSTDLQVADYVGPVRAREIINKVSVTVDEFLS
jgi:hypothetical protein